MEIPGNSGKIIKNKNGDFWNFSELIWTGGEQTPSDHTKKKRWSLFGAKSALRSDFRVGGVEKLVEVNSPFPQGLKGFLIQN